MLAERLHSNSFRRPVSRHRASGRSIVPLLVAGLLFLTGCRMLESTARLPATAVSAVVPGNKSTPRDPAVLQQAVQRYSDNFAARTRHALDEYAERDGRPEVRSQVLAIKVSIGSSILSIASGPNPTLNMLDLLALATLTRTVVERQATEPPVTPHLEPWLLASRSLETEAWALATNVLTATQEAEFRAGIERWSAEHAGDGLAFFARPPGFAAVFADASKESPPPGSLLGLVGLDPVGGLDPAVREVTRTRLFAERAMFVAQRMPFLLRGQIELLADDFLHRPEVSSALADASRLSRAAESASATAAQLPDLVTAERKAILSALEAQEGKLRELAAETGRTLAAGERMSTSLNSTLATFDALMRRFGVGEPGKSGSASPSDTNSAPFNILDYAQTAEQVAAMAQRLNELLTNASGTLDSPALDKRIAGLDDLSTRARADARSVLNHAFLLAAALVVLVFACAVAYRRLTRPKASGG